MTETGGSLTGADLTWRLGSGPSEDGDIPASRARLQGYFGVVSWRQQVLLWSLLG